MLPWTVACQAFLSLTYSLSIPKSMSIALVMPSTISSSDTLLSFYPQFFPASVTFTMSQLFASDDQNTGASVSASVLPMSIQGSCCCLVAKSCLTLSGLSMFLLVTNFIYSSIPAWRILGTKEPGGPQSMGWQRVGHD